MQSHEPVQPLTLFDKLSVILYRAGIIGISILVFTAGVTMMFSFDKMSWMDLSLQNNRLAIGHFLGIYFFTGISVVTIHLYAKRFRRLIRLLYLMAIAAALIMYFISGGLPVTFILKNPLGPVLLLPLAGTIGFIAMKEAFCFRLLEGYLLAILMPLVVLLMILKTFSPSLTGALLVFAGLLLGYLAWHKIKMPIGYDIGDKSLYER